jgi:hypothetical protein
MYRRAACGRTDWESSEYGHQDQHMIECAYYESIPGFLDQSGVREVAEHDVRIRNLRSGSGSPQCRAIDEAALAMQGRVGDSSFESKVAHDNTSEKL